MGAQAANNPHSASGQENFSQCDVKTAAPLHGVHKVDHVMVLWNRKLKDVDMTSR